MLTSNFVAPELSEALEIFKEMQPDLKGSQLVAQIEGKTVIDLSAGVSPDSLTSVFSVSKVLSALSIAKLVGEGNLDLDQKMSHYWPEFAANGKSDLTVRQVFSHQCGLPATDPHITVEMLHDDHAAAEALAKQKPLWQPGIAFGYHGITIGPLMSELVYRITGLSLQKYYEKELRTLAEADAYLGLPETLEHRVTPMNLDPLFVHDGDLKKYSPPEGWHSGGVSQWSGGKVGFEKMIDRAGRAFGLPSAEGVASARGLVKVMQWALGYGGAVPGVARSAIEDISLMQVYGYDICLEQDHRSHGTIVMKSTNRMPFGSYQAFGHDGATGSLLYADPIGEIVLGYTTTRMVFPGGADRDLQPIIDLLRKVAG